MKSSSSPESSEQGMAVEWWPIDRPQPFERNPRIHNESSVTKVAKSLKAFDWRQPLVVDKDGVLIIGHGRLLAAKSLGMRPGASARRGRPQPGAGQGPAPRRQPHRPGDRAGSTRGSTWSSKSWPAWATTSTSRASTPTSWWALAPSSYAEEDPIPEPPAEPVTRPGDLYILGKHRLLCGDSTNAEHVRRLMAGERAAPHGHRSALPGRLRRRQPPADLRRTAGRSRSRTRTSTGTPTSITTRRGLLRDFLGVALAEALTAAAALPVVWHDAHRRSSWQAWRENGLLPHQVIIWRKSRGVLRRCDFMWDYEPCLYGWIEGRRRRPAAAARQRQGCLGVTSAEHIEEGVAGTHPTHKPAELIRRPIIWHTRPGELIYEPFCGSGTAIIAAEQTGRRCYAMELSPAFCDVVVQRWQRLVGEQASLEHTDQ